MGYADLSIKKYATPRPGQGDSRQFCCRSMTIFPHINYLGSGSHLGLYVILNCDVSDYYCSSTNGAGFKILLHNPTETPRITDFGMLISPGRETRIVITPKLTTASRLIRDVPIEQRQCMFPGETSLKYFR